MVRMVDTTSERCVCRAQESAALVAAWNTRISEPLRLAVNAGRAIDVQKVQLSARLLVGITKGMPASFEEQYSRYSHHLQECPLACPVESVGLALLS